MNFHQAIADQNKEASMWDFNTFVKAFKNLPKPRIIPHFKNPLQREETVEIIRHIPLNQGVYAEDLGNREQQSGESVHE